MSDNPTVASRIWLVRHGEPDASSRGRCYGKLDVGLSSAGKRQIELASQMLRNEPLTAIYASPRKRTMESAKILSLGHSSTVRIDEGLREIDFGDFEGQRYEDIAHTHPEIYRQWMENPTETQFPNGENFQQMQERVLASACRIYREHRGETIAIVSHGGVNRILLSDILGIPNANIFRIAQRYAALNLVSWIGSYPSVELLNVSAE